MHIKTLAAIALGVALTLGAATAARAESVAFLGDGAKLTGTVPTGEVIRLTIPLPAGAEPRLHVALKGSKVPLSFLRSDLYDPAGNLIPDTSRFFSQRLRANNSSLTLRGFIAPTSGEYQLVIETNSDRLPNLVELRASGRLKVIRQTKIKKVFDTAGARIEFGLQVRDRVKAKFKRISGDLPDVSAWITPVSTLKPVPAIFNKQKKKGGVAGSFVAGFDGIHTFEFGYRDDGSVGEYAVTVKIRPIRSVGGLAVLRLANAPGIPLSVRQIDRSITLDFGTGAPGLAYDGSLLLASALYSGSGTPEIAVRLYDRDLFSLPGTPVPRPVVGPIDMQPGEVVGGHRMLFAANGYVVAWWTASGADAGLVRFGRDLLRTNFAQVVVGSATPIQDPFLASDGTRISFGIFQPPVRHLVRVYESDFSTVGALEIGGGQYAHANGAAAVWHPSNSAGTGNFFEFWAPDTTDATLPSDLHRQRYSQLWQPLTPDEKPIADAAITETMSTAVSFDVTSGVTIVHYVVPSDVSGAGVIYRALFDADGVLVPGSHVALSGGGRNRPTSLIIGSSLYLGAAGPGGPTVERFSLLRTLQP